MSFLDQFTGKDTQTAINEYTEVYGEILLGMNRKIKTIERKIKNLQPKTDSNRFNDKNIEILNVQSENNQADLKLSKSNKEQFQATTKNMAVGFNNQLQENIQQVQQYKNATKQMFTDLNKDYESLNKNINSLYLLMSQKDEALSEEIQLKHVQHEAEINQVKLSITELEKNIENKLSKTTDLIHHNKTELANSLDATDREINDKINNNYSEISNKINSIQTEFNQRYTTMKSSMENNILNLKKRQTYTWIIAGIVILIMIVWNI